MHNKSKGLRATPLLRGAQGHFLKFADYIAETHPSPHTTKHAPSLEGNFPNIIYSKYQQTNKSNGPARFPS
ncbi:hypothetical protein SAMN04487890_10195 [Mucilaginibacter polytrichastri]|nr:hypothetical protein SAMN04487890_10195 [Mucilaginibacter polytrichastri]